jgi:hypothetical protein
MTGRLNMNSGKKALSLNVFIIGLCSLIIIIVLFIKPGILLRNFTPYKLYKGNVLIDEEKFNEAEEMFSEVKKDHPEYAGPSMSLTVIYCKTKRPQKAIDELKYLKDKFPNDADVIDFIQTSKKEFNLQF